MDDKNSSLMDHFKDIEDPRIDRRKRHNLIDIIVVALCAMVAGCDTCDEFEIFGNSHLESLKKFIELPNGIPSHDTFERVFARIDPQQFRQSFLNWTKSITRIFADVIAIDGQTHRGARVADPVSDRDTNFRVGADCSFNGSTVLPGHLRKKSKESK